MSDALTKDDFTAFMGRSDEKADARSQRQIDAFSHGLEKVGDAISGARTVPKNGNGNGVAFSLFGTTVVMIAAVVATLNGGLENASENLTRERQDRIAADIANEQASKDRHLAANHAREDQHNGVSELMKTNKDELNAQIRRMESTQDEIIREVMRRIAHSNGKE